LPVSVARGASALLVLALAACGEDGPAAPRDPPAELRRLAAGAEVVPLERPEPAAAALVELGRALFFDKILSGNRDVSCATCHSPVYHTVDLLTLSIGTGGLRPSVVRELGTGSFLPRNAPDLFNRGHPAWTRLFWDGRVEGTPAGYRTPAGDALPAGLTTPLSAQALFPILGRAEMRGRLGENELADFGDDDPRPVWDAIVTRLRAIPGYDSLAAAAFPGRSPAVLTIADVGNAIAAFVGTAWLMDDSPFDRFLRGDNGALMPAATRGGLLFFGRARCGECHTGPLLADQEFHNVGVPPLGPGIDGGPDIGRAGVTGRAEDRFAFRTPSLRNVVHSRPYMHNGSIPTLEGAVRHYINVPASLYGFSAAGVDPRLHATMDLSAATLADVERTLDPRLRQPVPLSDRDVQDLVAFLIALTDPASSLVLRDIPWTVPSGLPVSDY
jgi:cytochrome c peroxidase